MSNLWDKTKELASDAAKATADAGKAVADKAVEVTASSAAAATSARDKTVEAGSKAWDATVEATKAAGTAATDAVDNGYEVARFAPSRPGPRPRSPEARRRLFSGIGTSASSCIGFDASPSTARPTSTSRAATN